VEVVTAVLEFIRIVFRDHWNIVFLDCVYTPVQTTLVLMAIFG